MVFKDTLKIKHNNSVKESGYVLFNSVRFSNSAARNKQQQTNMQKSEKEMRKTAHRKKNTNLIFLSY